MELTESHKESGPESSSYLQAFDFLWDPKQRERAVELAKSYDKATLEVWLKYVVEGGARDMYEFTQKYRGRANFCKQRDWGTEEPEIIYNKIKIEAQKMSGNPDFGFLYCPFMKKRAIDLANCGVDRELLGSALCFVLTGEDKEYFKINERERMSYLRRMGVL